MFFGNKCRSIKGDGRYMITYFTNGELIKSEFVISAFCDDLFYLSKNHRRCGFIYKSTEVISFNGDKNFHLIKKIKKIKEV